MPLHPLLSSICCWSCHVQFSRALEQAVLACCCRPALWASRAPSTLAPGQSGAGRCVLALPAGAGSVASSVPLEPARWSCGGGGVWGGVTGCMFLSSGQVPTPRCQVPSPLSSSTYGSWPCPVCGVWLMGLAHVSSWGVPGASKVTVIFPW